MVGGCKSDNSQCLGYKMDMLQPQSHWFALWQLKVMLLFLGSVDEILT